MKNEKDPNGLDQHAPGAKVDAGKNELNLIMSYMSRALWEVGIVGTTGAAKYTRGGWQKVEEGERRYRDALYRHLLKSYTEDYDPDSGLSHLAHAAWNALAILELDCRRREQENAPLFTEDFDIDKAYHDAMQQYLTQADSDDGVVR